MLPITFVVVLLLLLFTYILLMATRRVLAVCKGRLYSFKNYRLVLITAHPDDEVMFFSPTVLNLLSSVTPQKVFLLCITKGS